MSHCHCNVSVSHQSGTDVLTRKIEFLFFSLTIFYPLKLRDYFLPSPFHYYDIHKIMAKITDRQTAPCTHFTLSQRKSKKREIFYEI